MSLLESTFSTIFYHGCTWHYFTLLLSTIALLASTWHYYTLLWLYYSLLNSTIHLFGCTSHNHTSTWRYYTLPFLHLMLLQTTMPLLGSISLCYTLPWLYLSVYYTLQLAIQKAWSALDGPFFCFLVQTSVENSPSPCRDSISGFLGSFHSGGVFSGRRALTIECLVMSGCGLGHELEKNLWRKLTPSRSGNTGEGRWY